MPDEDIKKLKKYFNCKLTSGFKMMNENLSQFFIPLMKKISKIEFRLLNLESQFKSVIKKNKKINTVEKKTLTNENKKKKFKKKLKKLKINKENLENKSKKRMNINNINNFNIDVQQVKKYLDSTNIISDTKFFQELYLKDIEKEFYPIRNLDNKKHYQYWLDNSWHDDHGGEYIKFTIMKIIQKFYLKANNFSYYVNNIEQFNKNQKHINTIMEKRYQTKWLTSIKSLIKV